jgi:hypothetical protein
MKDGKNPANNSLAVGTFDNFIDSCRLAYCRTRSQAFKRRDLLFRGDAAQVLRDGRDGVSLFLFIAR